MSVIYNNVNLEEEFGMVCLGRGTYGAPARDIEQVHVPGRNGDLLIDNGGYLNFDLVYPECTIQEDFPYQARRLRNFLLNSPGYHKLTDSYDPGFYRMAEFRGPFIAEAHTPRNNMSSVFDLCFNCKPLRYLDAECAINLYGSSKIPYFHAKGSLSFQMSNGGASVRYIYVDDVMSGESYSAYAAAGGTASISLYDVDGHAFIVRVSADEGNDIQVTANNALLFRHYGTSIRTIKFKNSFFDAECTSRFKYWNGTITHEGGTFESGYYGGLDAWIDSETMAMVDNPSWRYDAAGKPPVLKEGDNTITLERTTSVSGSYPTMKIEPRMCML